ncbi:MAG: hypothetical protein JO033_08800 [Acidobacteriaceae bacterium]|nr:hypothetical protein [Acidobacteriaceae bacterium]MBV9499676.1 hypothetical protein [Acidobacteriaceae bacterium]
MFKQNLPNIALEDWSVTAIEVSYKPGESTRTRQMMLGLGSENDKPLVRDIPPARSSPRPSSRREHIIRMRNISFSDRA